MTAQSHHPRVKITIDVSEDERTYIKMLATKRRMTISEFMMSYVRPYIPHDEPNSETQKAMRDVNQKRNLHRCDSLEEFWKEMGIDPDA